MLSRPKSSRREVSDIQRSAVVTWHKAEKSSRQIAALEDLPRSTILSIIHRSRLHPEDLIHTKKRSGRPSKVSERDIRQLRHTAEADNDLCLAELSTPSKSGHNLYRNTTRKILRKTGIFRQKARVKPYLSPAHRKARRKWCEEHKDWSIDEWRSVIWTDESTFEVSKDSRVAWVSRRVGEAYLEKN